MTYGIGPFFRSTSRRWFGHKFHRGRNRYVEFVWKTVTIFEWKVAADCARAGIGDVRVVEAIGLDVLSAHIDQSRCLALKTTPMPPRNHSMSSRIKSKIGIEIVEVVSIAGASSGMAGAGLAATGPV